MPVFGYHPVLYGLTLVGVVFLPWGVALRAEINFFSYPSVVLNVVPPEVRDPLHLVGVLGHMIGHSFPLVYCEHPLQCDSYSG